jgi:hypothetical protein
LGIKGASTLVAVLDRRDWLKQKRCEGKNKTNIADSSSVSSYALGMSSSHTLAFFLSCNCPWDDRHT